MEPPSISALANGRYVIHGVLGSGGMAVVYRGFDTRLDLPRAIKVLNPELMISASVRRRFEIEARTMAKLHHPNIVGVYDIGVEDHYAYMVMELIEGGTLHDRIKAAGYLMPRAGLAAAQAILSALVLAHSKGVIHRDIKPHNVLVTVEGTPKLTDFGIAHLIGQDRALTASNAIIGTWAYMAPEQRRSSRRVTVHSDIYAVGATLYALLTAKDPFDIYNKEVQKEMFAGLPDPVVEVIERSTRYWPDERYPSASDMLAAIQRADAVLRPGYIEEPPQPARVMHGVPTIPSPPLPRPFDGEVAIEGAITDGAFVDESTDVRGPVLRLDSVSGEASESGSFAHQRTVAAERAEPTSGANPPLMVEPALDDPPTDPATLGMLSAHDGLEAVASPAAAEGQAGLPDASADASTSAGATEEVPPLGARPQTPGATPWDASSTARGVKPVPVERGPRVRLIAMAVAGIALLAGAAVVAVLAGDGERGDAVPPAPTDVTDGQASTAPPEKPAPPPPKTPPAETPAPAPPGPVGDTPPVATDGGTPPAPTDGEVPPDAIDAAAPDVAAVTPAPDVIRAARMERLRALPGL